jgi:hypothetical protein
MTGEVVVECEYTLPLSEGYIAGDAVAKWYVDFGMVLAT